MSNETTKRTDELDRAVHGIVDFGRKWVETGRTMGRTVGRTALDTGASTLRTTAEMLNRWSTRLTNDPRAEGRPDDTTTATTTTTTTDK